MSPYRSILASARSEVARNFLTYGIGAAFLSGISFFLVPIYTRVISPEDYGLLELINTGIAILATVLPLGLAQAFFLDYYHHQPEDRPKLTLDVSSLYALVAGPIILALILLSAPINRLLFHSRASTFLIIAALATAFLNFYRSLLFTALRLARRALPLVSFQVASGLGVAGLNIYLVYYRRLGIPAIVAVNLAAVVAACVAAVLFYLARTSQLRLNLTWARARAYFLLGIPLMPAAASVWVLSASDRWVLTAYGYERELGLYSLAYKFGTLYSLLVVEPFISAYQPKMFASYRVDVHATEQRNTRVLCLYLAIFLPAVTLVFLVGKPAFTILVGREYHSAYAYILPIVLGYVMVGATSIALNLVLFERRSGSAALVQGAGAVFNVAANVLLVRWYGAWAAAVITALSFAATFGLALRLRDRVWRAVRGLSHDAEAP